MAGCLGIHLLLLYMFLAEHNHLSKYRVHFVVAMLGQRLPGNYSYLHPLFHCVTVTFVSYRTPSPGYYNDDDVPDFLVRWQHGPGFPMYYHSIVSEMMTSGYGHAVCITGPLRGESIDDQWFPFTKCQQCKAWMFSLSLDWTSCSTNSRVPAVLRHYDTCVTSL